MLFFVIVHNTHYHKTHYVGGKLSHPACALKVCDVEVQTGVKAFYIFTFYLKK